MGLLGSFRFGSGIIVVHLPNGSWSAPSAVALGGIGGGGQIGVEMTDFVLVLNDDAAVTSLVESGTLTLGANVSVALGAGRSTETGSLISTKGIAGIDSYSKTCGVYGGLTLEAGVVIERSSANTTLYKRKLKTKHLLRENIPPPQDAEPLMRLLGSKSIRPKTVIEASVEAKLPIPSRDVAPGEPRELDAGQPMSPGLATANTQKVLRQPMQHVSRELDSQEIPRGSSTPDLRRRSQELIPSILPQETLQEALQHFIMQETTHDFDAQGSTCDLATTNYQKEPQVTPRIVQGEPQELATNDQEPIYELATSITREVSVRRTTTDA